MLVLPVAAVVLSAFCQSSSVAFVLNHKDTCKAYCDSTFSPEQVESLKGCGDGCQLFSLLDFASKDNNKTGVVAECKQACERELKSEDSKKGCVAGCEHQSSFTKTGHMEVSLSSKNPFFHYAHNMMDKMADDMENFGQHMRGGLGGLFSSPRLSSTSFDDSWRQAQAMMNSMQERMNRMFGGDPFFKNFFNELTSQNVQPQEEPGHLAATSARPLSAAEDMSVQVNPLWEFASRQRLHGKHAPTEADQIFNGRNVDNLDDRGRRIMEVEMIPLTPNDWKLHHLDGEETTKADGGRLNQGTFKSPWFNHPHEPSPPVDTKERSSKSWLAYLKHYSASSATRWLLLAAMLISLACMVWICVLIQRTMPARRVYKAYFPTWLTARHDEKQGGILVAEDGTEVGPSDKNALVNNAAPVEGFDAPPPYAAQPAEVHKVQAEEGKH